MFFPSHAVELSAQCKWLPSASSGINNETVWFFEDNAAPCWHFLNGTPKECYHAYSCESRLPRVGFRNKFYPKKSLLPMFDKRVIFTLEKWYPWKSLSPKLSPGKCPSNNAMFTWVRAAGVALEPVISPIGILFATASCEALQDCIIAWFTSWGCLSGVGGVRMVWKHSLFCCLCPVLSGWEQVVVVRHSAALQPLSRTMLTCGSTAWVPFL